MTSSQTAALHLLSVQNLSGRDARKLLGATAPLTLTALARRALVSFDGEGRWQITPKGRRRVAL